MWLISSEEAGRRAVRTQFKLMVVHYHEKLTKEFDILSGSRQLLLRNRRMHIMRLWGYHAIVMSFLKALRFRNGLPSVR
jgi:hypothetical protein